MAQTVFERVGGFMVVRKIVSAFYDSVLDSPLVQHHFAEVSMPRLIDHQTQFISQLLGGPVRISDETLQHAHARLRITPEEFEEIIRLLLKTLEEAGLDSEDIEFVMREVRRREPLIVTVRAAA
jgi:hemoglobin